MGCDLPMTALIYDAWTVMVHCPMPSPITMPPWRLKPGHVVSHEQWPVRHFFARVSAECLRTGSREQQYREKNQIRTSEQAEHRKKGSANGLRHGAKRPIGERERSRQCGGYDFPIHADSQMSPYKWPSGGTAVQKDTLRLARWGRMPTTKEDTVQKQFRGSKRRQPTEEKGVQMEAFSRCALRCNVGNSSTTSDLQVLD